jgi:hypothetical protein
MYVLPDVNMSGVLTALLAQLGTAGTGLIHVHLFTNSLSPSKTNVLADFTELTNVEVPGYAAALANWFAGTPVRQPTGGWEGPDSLADPSFLATGVVPSPIAVIGYFLTDSTDAVLLGSGAFGTPFTFTSLGDGFVLAGNPVLTQVDTNTLQVALPDLEPS